LTDSALAARDNGEAEVIVKFSREKQDRELSAARGGSLMTQDEMNDEIPF
jgi:nitrous oxide reductase accessory protein NosL